MNMTFVYSYSYKDFSKKYVPLNVFFLLSLDLIYCSQALKTVNFEELNVNRFFTKLLTCSMCFAALVNFFQCEQLDPNISAVS